MWAVVMDSDRPGLVCTITVQPVNYWVSSRGASESGLNYNPSSRQSPVGYGTIDLLSLISR